METTLAILGLVLATITGWGFRRLVQDPVARTIGVAFCFASLLGLRDHFSSSVARHLMATGAAMALGIACVPERAAQAASRKPAERLSDDERNVRH